MDEYISNLVTYFKTKEAYLVDSDSWQIEGYPAVSRNRTFTPPELIKSGSKQVFFTPDQEYYQIALLIFMIMMPGKFPYALRKSDSEEESIAEKSFAFGIGSDMRRSRDAERPQGVWRIAWDHLPYLMCNLFYNTFHANGKNPHPEQDRMILNGRRISMIATKEESDDQSQRSSVIKNHFDRSE